MLQKIAKALAGLVLVVAYVVILESYIAIDLLPAQLRALHSLGFTDGIAFFFSGIISYSIAADHNRSNLVSDLLLPASVLIVLLLMSTMVMSYMLSLSTDVAILFSSDELAVLEESKQLLAWGEVLSYSLIALAGLNAMFAIGNRRERQLIIALTLFGIQLVMVAGFVLNRPLWAGELATVSQSARPAVVILFLLLSTGLLASLLDTFRRPSTTA
jgi:hypothetical protein